MGKRVRYQQEVVKGSRDEITRYYYRGNIRRIKY